jgi:dUTP pyrophosphatase
MPILAMQARICAAGRLRAAAGRTPARGDRRRDLAAAGYAAFVHPRSGLAAQHGISIVNAPGTVDAGYRGEIKVCLINTDRSRPVSIARGDRIAQLVIQPVSLAAFVPVSELPARARELAGTDQPAEYWAVPGAGATSGAADQEARSEGTRA